MVVECERWTAVQIVDGYGDVHRWAQAVSLERRATAVSFFVFEGTWNYAIFDAGEHVLGMQFFPHERPVLHGDPRAAAALLGCHAELFRRYHEAILAACDEDDELFDDDYPRAYDDDEYGAADEYGFYDFARRAGLPDDPIFDADPIGVRAGGERPDDWTGLPSLPK